MGCEAGLGLELGFAVVGQECHELVFVHVGAEVLEGVCEPTEGVYSYDGAAFEEGVEDGVVLGAAVVFAEEVVFAADDGGALHSLYGVVVELIAGVEGVALEAVPHFVGVVECLAQRVAFE